MPELERLGEKVEEPDGSLSESETVLGGAARELVK